MEQQNIMQYVNSPSMRLQPSENTALTSVFMNHLELASYKHKRENRGIIRRKDPIGEILMTAQMKCKILSFEDVYSMVRNVSEKIKDSGFEPTTIIGLARGGWVPARLLCDFLGITDLVSLKVEHWLETGKTSNEAIIKYPVTTSLTDKRVLIFDDITDTGESLIIASEHIENLHPEESRVGVMQYITSSKRVPDYYAEKVTDWYWFIYPWNWIEDTSTLIVRLMSEDQTLTWNSESINASLHKHFGITWDQNMLEHILNLMNERGQIETLDGDTKFKLKTRTVIRL